MQGPFQRVMHTITQVQCRYWINIATRSKVNRQLARQQLKTRDGFWSISIPCWRLNSSTLTDLDMESNLYEHEVWLGGCFLFFLYIYKTKPCKIEQQLQKYFIDKLSTLTHSVSMGESCKTTNHLTDVTIRVAAVDSSHIHSDNSYCTTILML